MLCFGLRRISISRWSWGTQPTTRDAVDQYESNQFAWPLFLQLTCYCHILHKNVRGVVKTTARRQTIHVRCVLAEWSTCTFHPYYMWCSNEQFPDYYTGHGSPTTPTPSRWPPLIPDLATIKNSLWDLGISGIIKMTITSQLWNRLSPWLHHK
jgi:hypothetical protein